MAVQLSLLLEGLERIAPPSLAEEWDNVGLLVGDRSREVSTILLALDATLPLLEEAIERGVDTIITHHPCIFRPLHAIDLTTPGGIFLERALAQQINVIACHTNFDSATAGVSDALGALLGLDALCPLRPVGGDSETGLGRIGNYPKAIPFTQFMERAFLALGSDAVQLAGKPPQSVSRVALCGGSGSDFAETAFAAGADIYLSSEIKHSTARWAEDAGFCIVDASHYATEKPAMLLLGATIETLQVEKDWGLAVYQSMSEKAPFIYATKGNTME